MTFTVHDYIEAGPGAVRTAVHHQGDRKFQTARFRELERRFPEIEHLGSWHSHHPNGLQELSRGDVDGYLATVNNSGHNHDYFLATLAVDATGFARSRHFIFIRGDAEYYEISRECLELLPRLAGPPKGHGPDLGPWTHTDDGRRILARDRRIAAAMGSLQFRARSGRLILSGSMGTAETALVYPSAPGGADGILTIRDPQAPSELMIGGTRAADARCLLAASRALERLSKGEPTPIACFSMWLTRALEWLPDWRSPV